MSSLFQGLTNAQGRVEITLLGMPVLPTTATHFRGIARDAGRVLAVTDDGLYPRVYIGGVAVHNPTGIVILSGTAAPYYTLPGALRADTNGSISTDNLNPPDLIHQAVGLSNNGALHAIE